VAQLSHYSWPTQRFRLLGSLEVIPQYSALIELGTGGNHGEAKTWVSEQENPGRSDHRRLITPAIGAVRAKTGRDDKAEDAGPE
jgi:hypothetical protein